MAEYITLPQARLPIVARPDVLVAGGGSAGLSAAVAAARNGADVLLLERFSYLGGLATGGLIILLLTLDDGAGKQAVGGLCQEIVERMEARDAEKRAAVAAAKFPVEGLGFGDGIVMLNGVPFDQASAAETLKVSVAIGMAANPKLRVILIRDGSLLDEDSRAQISAMAKESDYQLWIEVAGRGEATGFVIEDGQVVEQEAVNA